MRTVALEGGPDPARRRTGSLFGVLVDLAGLTGITVLIGWYCTAFTGFPKGYDVWGHMSKVRMLIDGFPDVNWNDQWYGGQPAFLGSYPPGYHGLVAGLAWVSGWSLPHTMVVLAGAAVVVLILGCYLLVFGVTGRRIPALLGAGVLLGSPTMWDQVVELGLYPRFTAMSFNRIEKGRFFSADISSRAASQFNIEI